MLSVGRHAKVTVDGGGEGREAKCTSELQQRIAKTVLPRETRCGQKGRDLRICKWAPGATGVEDGTVIL